MTKGKMGKGEMAKIGGEMAKGEVGKGEMGINRSKRTEKILILFKTPPPLEIDTSSNIHVYNILFVAVDHFGASLELCRLRCFFSKNTDRKLSRCSLETVFDH
jgi:hypothetical protein